MSRAFVKESDGSEPIQLMERAISSERNYVTQQGLNQINSQVKKYTELLASTDQSKDMEIAEHKRDLAYWKARLASAELVLPVADKSKIAFGMQVTLVDNSTYQIVGQDEANPELSLISYLSPLARQLIGKEIGDEITIGHLKKEIIKIE